MAAVTAPGLRALARDAIAACGARGFVRFAPEGDEALLVTDALRRCEDGARRERVLAALHAAGFDCREEGALLRLTPGDALLARLGCGATPPDTWDWESELSPAFALADRWLRLGGARGTAQREDAGCAALTPAGRRMALETARLLWRPRAQVLAGLGGLRARAAAMQRVGDTGALPLCGGMLLNWCRAREKESCAYREIADASGKGTRCAKRRREAEG